MNQLSITAFEGWLDAYGTASQLNDPQASAELFSEAALYFETPFSEPMVGREAIYQYWARGAQALSDKVSSYEILAVTDNAGIANWRSEFTVIASGKRFALNCLFIVEFDDHGKCHLFREWWHIQEQGPAALQNFYEDQS